MGEKARHLIFKASMAIMLLTSMQISKSNAESPSIEGLWAKDLASCPFDGPVKSGYMLTSSDFLLTHVADCKLISNIIGPDSINVSLKCRNRNTGNPWDQKFEIQKASSEGFTIKDTSGALTRYYSCLAMVRKQPNQTVQLPEPEPPEYAVRQASSNPPTTGTGTPQSPSSSQAQQEVPFSPPVQQTTTTTTQRPGPQVSPKRIETVEEAGIGDTPDQARQDAARRAIQRVAGIYIDNRRRVEERISGQKVDQVIEEKILLYTNAYVDQIKVLSTKNRSGIYEVRAIVSVVASPIIKVLQENDIPTVPFDAPSIGEKQKTVDEENAAAKELYADLLRNVDKLVTIRLGNASVTTEFPSPPDETWFSIPLTWIADLEATRNWREKFSKIAQETAQLSFPLRPPRLHPEEVRQGCDLRIVPDLYIQEVHPTSLPPPAADFIQKFGPIGPFSGVNPGAERVAICFASALTQSGIGATCMAREFPNVRASAQSSSCISGRPCSEFDRHSSHVALKIQFVGRSGEIVYEADVPFVQFPALPFENTTRRPNSMNAKPFYNFCVKPQGLFFSRLKMFPEAGKVFIFFPPPGANIDSVLNVRMPKAIIGQIASIKAAIFNEGR